MKKQNKNTHPVRRSPEHCQRGPYGWQETHRRTHHKGAGDYDYPPLYGVSHRESGHRLHLVQDLEGGLFVR